MDTLNSEVYKDFDIFFYYGKNDLEIENRSDVLQNIMQPKRSLFYDRNQDAAGMPSYENMPNGIGLQINLRFDIVTSLAKRNQVVSNGSDDNPDRRIAISQNLIQIEKNRDSLKVNVFFIPFSNFQQVDSVSNILSTNI